MIRKGLVKLCMHSNSRRLKVTKGNNFDKQNISVESRFLEKYGPVSLIREWCESYLNNIIRQMQEGYPKFVGGC